MTPLKLASFVVFLFASIATSADTPWNGKKAAVSLTYDDALNVHLDNVIPVLDKYDLTATFYITGNFDPFRQRLDDWRATAINGHELGNHTLFHPCAANMPGRDWVHASVQLDTWPLERFLANLQVNNTLLEAVDGKRTRSFAYPCGDTQAGGQDYIAKITPSFIAARAVGGQPAGFQDVQLMRIPSYMVNGDSAETLISQVRQAIEKNTWLVFLFHGVGGEHGLNIDLNEHNKLVTFLQDNIKDVWVAPVVEVAGYVNAHRR